MATISNTPRPGYVWDATDNVWYPIGVGAHQHTNAADTPAVMPYSTYAAAGKNKIINGDFNINQRAFTSTTSDNTFGFDRFNMLRTAAAGSVTFSAETFTLGAAPIAGYEGKNFLQIVTAGQAAASDNARFQQQIESVRSFAGETVTVSFWAKAASGTPSIAIATTQNFGTGGSPSSDVNTPFGKVAITTSWARYSLTAAVPSISGKTLGTNNNDTLRVRIYLSAGSDFATIASSLGVQNNTFQVWGIQAEAGSTATAFQTATGNPASELAACQRYYYRFTNTTANPSYLGIGTYYSTTTCYIVLQWPVTMRIAPTVATSSQTGWLTQAGSQRNSTAFAVDVASTGYADVYVTTSSHTLGIGAVVGLLGSSNHWVEASAEL
jgi:hypothetical protein